MIAREKCIGRHKVNTMVSSMCIVLQVESFPKQVYLWGSILEKNRLDALVGALGLVGRGFGCAGRAAWGWAWCWARWAGLGVDLAVLGALRGVGRGCWARWLGALRGWAWCWARWAGLGVDLALLGALGWGGAW